MCLSSFQIGVCLREKTYFKRWPLKIWGFRKPAIRVLGCPVWFPWFEAWSCGVLLFLQDWLRCVSSRRLSYRQTLRHDLSWPQLKKMCFFFVRLRLPKNCIIGVGWIILRFLPFFTGGKSPWKGSHLGANLRFSTQSQTSLPGSVLISSLVQLMTLSEVDSTYSRRWFQIFVMFILIGEDSHFDCIIYFRWVETTNQYFFVVPSDEPNDEQKDGPFYPTGNDEPNDEKLLWGGWALGQ